MAGAVDVWMGGRAAGGGRHEAHDWCALLAGRGAHVQQYFFFSWPSEVSSITVHLASEIFFVRFSDISISASLGSL